MNNYHDNDVLKTMMKAALLQQLLMETREVEHRKKAGKPTAGAMHRRWHLEHHPSIETSITDRDMLLLHIDIALDVGNAEMFKLLTDELKGMEAPV